jgi:predicted RNase H-like nuclease (RuvC/YqgF family)
VQSKFVVKTNKLRELASKIKWSPHEIREVDLRLMLTEAADFIDSLQTKKQRQRYELRRLNVIITSMRGSGMWFQSERFQYEIPLETKRRLHTRNNDLKRDLDIARKTIEHLKAELEGYKTCTPAKAAE